MKLLTRIRLVNWHLFENISINCNGTTYFIGINGAGKSTILDAVQFALVGGQRDVRFNQARVERWEAHTSKLCARRAWHGRSAFFPRRCNERSCIGIQKIPTAHISLTER